MSTLEYGGVARFYTELAEIPIPTSAQFVASNSTTAVIRVSYSVRDHERDTKRSISKTFTLTRPESQPVDWTLVSSTVYQDASDVQASVLSPSKKRQAILREIAEPSNGVKKRFVEIWADSRLEASLEVTKRHGPFHPDDYFKSLSFSPSETALLYTAEANPESVDNLGDDPYPTFRFNPNFGEGLYTKKRPTLYIFRWREPSSDAANFEGRVPKKDLSLVSLSLVQSPATPVVFGQASFATETQIFATGYEQTADGRILGIKSCFNRPSSIWELSLTDQSNANTTYCAANKIEIPGRSNRSPRILFDGDRKPCTLVWLSNPTFGPHASTVSLYTYDLAERLPRVLLEPDQANNFPGLYTDYSLIDSPFIKKSGEETYVVAQSLWRSRTKVVSVALDGGYVSDETKALDGQDDKQSLYNWSLLSSDGNGSVVCSRSTPTSPPQVVLLTIENGSFANIQVLDEPVFSAELQQELEKLTPCVIPVPNRYPTESVVILSKEPPKGQKPICVTVVHGGPHGTSTTAFTPSVLALALDGYTVSMPNYTGSMGFGEKYIQALLGRCGELDVGDCIATVRELIKLGISEEGRQVVSGGSHGGFITAHLIGQYPDVFSAAVLRNPVISVGEFPTSDIPDWAYGEFGVAFGPRTHMNPGTFAQLYSSSPIAHVDRVRTPALLLIGEDDLRVPTSQGKGYYHALKGRNQAPVEMFVFPKESHPLDGVEAARVSVEATRDWFARFSR
ncbi:Alpha/Beta hydrolase protein [Pisolithus orientalis]|uniref:Alpha/Beta hydrolase protein n=1 Tax=Pisolithus orientalis TaxID=936130 RepID=UPI0022250D48|nr:Alpha/Beta hydrolase protein [Pisolithus orientalis]KAI6003273.1 Alpha/Beta hydrolase protein [Pisolithus orientalis]